MSKELLEGVASNDFECVKRVIVPHLAKKQTGKKALLGLLDEKDTDGNTSLHIACKRGYEKIALYLVEVGASLTSVNNEGETATQAASPKLKGMITATNEIKLMKDEIMSIPYINRDRSMSLRPSENHTPNGSPDVVPLTRSHTIDPVRDWH